MNTLKAIQVLSKIGKILSKIVYICCIVGFCSCIVGYISVIVGAESLKLGGVTLNSILKVEAGVTVGTVYAALAVGMILCAGEAVLSGFAAHYFKRELNDGTPFSLDGAKELLRLGILTICIPLGTQIVAAIVYSVIENRFEITEPFSLDNSVSVSLGVMFIIISLICKYGAEQQLQKAQAES